MRVSPLPGDQAAVPLEHVPDVTSRCNHRVLGGGLDVKTVQARLRHASAKTTLDVYGHMWPDKDEASRAAVAAARAQAGSRTSGTDR